MEYNLNAQQMEAVTFTEGYIRVIAGAGTGKTRALTHRFAFLVNELGILPGNILCVTFTNKAANEMKQRIHNIIGDNDTGYINTFHGFCVTILQEDIYALQYPKSFLVLDNSDIDSMLRIIYDERGLTMRDMTFSHARDMIEIQKLFRKPDYFKDMLGMSIEALQEKYEQAQSVDDIIFYGYLYQEKKCFALDYNDLIKFVLHLFSVNEEIRQKWQQRLEYIMIDEFQDIDALQYELMQVLCAYHKNLFIVGDPDQTIYTWRGADVKYIQDFHLAYPGTKTVMLLENYRSSRSVILAANSLIDKNRNRIKKELLPAGSRQGQVLFEFANTGEEEAKWIAGKIQELYESGVSYRDITVMYRAHYVSRAIEEELLREKIPYHIYSGVPFFGRKEIKDALSYMRMVTSQDDLSFRRICNVPKRNLGRSRMEYLESYAANHKCTLYQALKKTCAEAIFKGTGAEAFIGLIESYSGTWETMPVTELLAGLLEKSGYEEMLRTEGSQERLDDLAELRQSIHEYEITCGEEADAAHYLAHVAMFTNMDEEVASDKVKMMTVHAAKGLEFPYVFLCGMNEGVFPSGKVKEQKAMEEERRLAFVAFTRAKERLYLSGAQGRNFDGSPRYPSRFVLDVDPSLIDYDHPAPEGLIADARLYIDYQEKCLYADTAGNLFAPGDRVRHEYLGEGEIQSFDSARQAYMVKFDKVPTSRAISLRIHLEKI